MDDLILEDFEDDSKIFEDFRDKNATSPIVMITQRNKRFVALE